MLAVQCNPFHRHDVRLGFGIHGVRTCTAWCCTKWCCTDLPNPAAPTPLGRPVSCVTDQYLSAAEFAMNNSVNHSSGQSLYYLNYGFNPALPMWRELDLLVPAAKCFTKSYVTRMEEAEACLEAAQQQATRDYDRNKKHLDGAPFLRRSGGSRCGLGACGVAGRWAALRGPHPGVLTTTSTR